MRDVFASAGQQGQRKGPDFNLPLEVTLEELYTGTAVQVRTRGGAGVYGVRILQPHAAASGTHAAESDRGDARASWS